ncbi:MotA/TolQ/ExbB proton channel family protein [Bacillus sp. FJAT-29814]|uniref:MotA/TolQ/ExbB proton channel family protein n=1 Tax=Bacillus sp. FJAT-29814 TaxID=1729688 RepID=UPI00082CD1BB|nr:MotA/TolQ/ExbB proton channel family protein [Bacillus sp. FJAT-29814]
MKKLVMTVLMFVPAFVYLLLYGKTMASGNSLQIASNVLVMGIFIALGVITKFSIDSNSAMFKFLSVQDDELSKNPELNKLAGEIWRAYNYKKEKSKSQLNISTFIEMFMSEFQIDNKINIVKQMKLIQTLASIAILLGVLGTFIGLVISLAALKPTAQLDQSIFKILGGIHTAFYTSIAGILFSIAINLHTKIRNSEQLLLQLMLKIENYIYQKDLKTSDYFVVEAIGEVKTAVHNMGRAFLDVASFSNEFKIATDNLIQYNESFRLNTDEVSVMFKNMKQITGQFAKRTAQLHDDFEKLFGYFETQNSSLNGVKQTLEQSRNDLKVVLGEQSMVIGKIMNQSESVQQQYQAMFNDTRKALNLAYKELNGFFQLISSQITQIAVQNESQLEMHKQLTDSIYKQIKKEQAGLLKQLKEANAHNNETAATFSNAVNRIETNAVNQTQANEAMANSLSVLSSHVKQTNELIVKINQTFASGTNGTTASLKSLEQSMSVLQKSIDQLSGKMNERQLV